MSYKRNAELNLRRDERVTPYRAGIRIRSLRHEKRAAHKETRRNGRELCREF